MSIAGLGDRLSGADVARLRARPLYGRDVDQRMVRLAAMNLTLRGLENARLGRHDGLTRPLRRAERAELDLPPDGFDVMLANPPVSGKLDKDRIDTDVKVPNTKATELRFLQHMLNRSEEGGRCAVVVPEGVLFGSTGAHRDLRRRLIENNTVEAVLSPLGGVFNPQSGGQDLGAGVLQRRDHRARDVPARRQ